MKIIDLDSNGGMGTASLKLKQVVAGPPEDHSDFEILFVERAEETKSLLVHAKDKCSIDLEGKVLVIFLLQQPDSYMASMDNIQTSGLPQFEYMFNPSKPKSMGQGRDCFPSQRKQHGQDQLQLCSFSDCVCSICQQCVLITDEYIRLLDCNHIYHRICMIHSIAQVTNKRFFLTPKEQQAEFDDPEQPLSLCPNCKHEDAQIGYLSLGRVKGYRKHMIFDLLKDKADLFYTKMKERKAQEIAACLEDAMVDDGKADGKAQNQFFGGNGNLDEDSEDHDQDNEMSGPLVAPVENDQE